MAKQTTEEKLAGMTHNELLEEVVLQYEWLQDDEFELGSFNRGDGGAKRMDYITKVEAEIERREVLIAAQVTGDEAGAT